MALLDGPAELLPHLAPFHAPVVYHGSVMSVANLIGYQAIFTVTDFEN
jgi:hypothetical protein